MQIKLAENKSVKSKAPHFSVLSQF